MVQRNGFTLLELLITITIAGILMSAAMLGFDRARSSARDSQRLSNVLTIAKALDTYSAQYRGRYPNTLDDSGLAPYLPNDTLPAGPYGTDEGNISYAHNQVSVAFSSYADTSSTVYKSPDPKYFADRAQTQYVLGTYLENVPNPRDTGSFIDECTLLSPAPMPADADPALAPASACTKQKNGTTLTTTDQANLVKLQRDFFYPGPSCSTQCPGDSN